MDGFEIYNDVNYSNLPSNDECILNAVQISKLVGEPASTIRSWAEKHQNNLYIKKINGRFVYTSASVEQFRFIKSLCREKKMTHDQIEEHLNKKGFQYQKYDGGLINPEDPLGYEALASQIMIKNQDMMKQFLMEFVKYQEDFKEEIKSDIKSEVAITVDDRMESNLNEFKDGFKEELKEDLKQEFQAYIDQRELDYKNRDNEMIDLLKKHMEDSQRKFEENNVKKSFWSRIFNK